MVVGLSKAHKERQWPVSQRKLSPSEKAPAWDVTLHGFRCEFTQPVMQREVNLKTAFRLPWAGESDFTCTFACWPGGAAVLGG
jgi:hypothetical protein